MHLTFINKKSIKVKNKFGNDNFYAYICIKKNKENMEVLKALGVFIFAWVAAWGIILLAFFISGYIIFGVEDLIFTIRQSFRKRKREREKTLCQ
jgi:type III secretory pathway component EscU